jgi:pimeloyl-ACP methyl ester carboxylesterase
MTGQRLRSQIFNKIAVLSCCFAILLSLAGCAPAEKPRPPASFEPGECPFTLPTSNKVECGVLMVPENRSDSESNTIQIQVAVIKTDNPSPAPDPVVYLAGGPGASGSGEMSVGLGPHAKILEKRDLVIVDQRGTGYSTPSLICPEYRQAYFDALASQLPYEKFSQAYLATLPACQQRLQSAGVDLSAYNNRESAADLEDLRQALGYDRWNLLGTSYGTRLALTALRDYPSGVRSVILDSTFPPQVNPYSGWILSQERVFRLLFDRCAADEQCHAAYPNLEQDFYTLLEKLDAEPAIVAKANPFTQKKYEVLVDGDMLINLLFLAFYDTAAIPHLPGVIEEMLQGNTKSLARFMDMLFIIPSGIAWGMHYAVLCSTESVFTDYAKVEKELAGAQPRLAEGMRNDHRIVLEICQAWDRDDPAAAENRLVRSSVPALVLAGEFDPVTPPEWGEQTANALKHGYFYEFPGLSHGVTWWDDFTRGCINQMVHAFLDDPTRAPESACMEDIPELEFFTP